MREEGRGVWVAIDAIGFGVPERLGSPKHYQFNSFSRYIHQRQRPKTLANVAG
ncbi:MAG: hypothetical protein LCH89_14975 [Proteobacteria bacterium]|nr:hypothetical protein [Pseudomonadota bacterium]